MWAHLTSVSRSIIAAVLCVAWMLALPFPAMGQRAGLGIDLLSTIDGPPPPVPPAVLSRDETGRVTGRAVRVTSPLRVDGQLDEMVYQAAEKLREMGSTD